MNTFFWHDCSQDGSRREARRSWTGRSSSVRDRTRSGSGSWRSSGSKPLPRNASASNARKNDEDASTSSDRVTTTGLLRPNWKIIAHHYFNEGFDPIQIFRQKIEYSSFYFYWSLKTYCIARGESGIWSLMQKKFWIIRAFYFVSFYADEIKWRRENGWYARLNERDGKRSFVRIRRGRRASRRRERTKDRTSSSRSAAPHRECWNPPTPVALLSGAPAGPPPPLMSWCSPPRNL